ncbi:MerR family transcriptional regulator [Kitasatospora sp. NPDC057518]|uniref:MerR family transcriptional regulator n=1 Tax=Kitasatospora sp. NPDC057518 TaxID=3346155 RepID=UPI0036CF6065
MRIGELATRTGSTARALRHYEQAGLIDSERAPNGYREYGEPAVVRVRNIRALVAAGLTLEDVRPLLGCLDGDVLAVRPSEQVLGIARRRLAVLERRIAAQTEARDRLAAALAAAGVSADGAHADGAEMDGAVAGGVSTDGVGADG